MARSSAHPLRFLLNGEPVVVTEASPHTTLLEWLRESRGLTGTKEGCAEGDCGACTVVCAELEPGRPGLAWRPINACLRLLPSLHGRAVFTVESLAGADGTPHPLQHALVATHASQCGFCTPGFAMSLFGLYKNEHAPSRATVVDALSGNLCRCTGYVPILAAAQVMYDRAACGDAQGWRSAGIAADGSRVISQEEEMLAAQLAALASDETLAYEARGRRWWAPRTLDELADLRAAHPDARIVAGATDVGLWITKQHRDIGDVLYAGDVDALRDVVEGDSHIDIGAAVPLAAAFAALVAEWPELAEVATRFASVPIRNSGTLGGNVANGSPIGDSMPVLIALGATVVLRKGAATRELPLESFYLAYQRTALQPGELVTHVRVPRRRPGTIVRAYKQSKRFDQDISCVLACFVLALDGTSVADVRIGCGGVAPTPVRAVATERALRGGAWSEAHVAAAAAVLANEFAPIDDLRASARYRRTVLGNLLVRCHLETTAPDVPTRVAALAGASP
ncbi:MAG: xanthine dehydrogenase small subunit [Burkholderiales bacterium]